MFDEQVNDWTGLLEAVESSSEEITISAKTLYLPKYEEIALYMWAVCQDSPGRVRDARVPRSQHLEPVCACTSSGRILFRSNSPETPDGYLFLPCSLALKKKVFFSIFKILSSKFVEISTLLLLFPETSTLSNVSGGTLHTHTEWFPIIASLLNTAKKRVYCLDMRSVVWTLCQVDIRSPMNLTILSRHPSTWPSWSLVQNEKRRAEHEFI